MSDYSTSPQEVLLANQQKGYVGLHIEQGVPLLDRDLNLLHDLISATIRSLIANYVGNGVHDRIMREIFQHLFAAGFGDVRGDEQEMQFAFVRAQSVAAHEQSTGFRSEEHTSELQSLR